MGFSIENEDDDEDDRRIGGMLGQSLSLSVKIEQG
jgi:hypothetical protein